MASATTRSLIARLSGYRSLMKKGPKIKAFGRLVRSVRRVRLRSERVKQL
ncbi:MAG: hypothetical protein QOD67_3357 [Caballeronia sp.]|nr:hypothetical protein [Caballeronia sp.]